MGYRYQHILFVKWDHQTQCLMLPTHFQIQGMVHDIGFTLPCLSHLIEKNTSSNPLVESQAGLFHPLTCWDVLSSDFGQHMTKSYKSCSSDDSLPQNHLTCNALTIVRYSAPLYIYMIYHDIHKQCWISEQIAYP